MPTELNRCFRLFDELESQRTTLIADLSQWPASRLSFIPAPNTWSAVQVLDHIVRAEAGTIADIRLGLQHPHYLGAEPRPNVAALDRALRSDRRFQVPADASEIHPAPQTTLPEVSARWEKARTNLGSILEGLTAADTPCGVFHHPFAGWMTVEDVLHHFAAHLYHHNFQLDRLRSASAHCCR